MLTCARAICTQEGASTSGSVVGACVLERLPVSHAASRSSRAALAPDAADAAPVPAQLVVPPTPSWESEYKAWQQELELQKGQLKEYPRVVRYLRVDTAPATPLPPLPPTPLC
jgi:alpha/beta superfamily hydrolase